MRAQSCARLCGRTECLRSSQVIHGRYNYLSCVIAEGIRVAADVRPACKGSQRLSALKTRSRSFWQGRAAGAFAYRSGKCMLHAGMLGRPGHEDHRVKVRTPTHL